MHQLKYEGWWRAAEAMAEAMRALEPLTGQVCLIPVPLGARRLRTRGYNQSERLAAALGRRTGARRCAPTSLARRRETGTQTALTPEARQRQRRRGVRGARGARDCELVLVDDVFTTGATLAAAAAALYGAGARRVEAVTFARAVEPVASDRGLSSLTSEEICMAIRVGINGFGRIGRNVVRAAKAMGARSSTSWR